MSIRRTACLLFCLVLAPGFHATFANDAPPTEVGWLVGASASDKDIAGQNDTMGSWGPVAGVRVGHLFGDTLLWFGDATGAQFHTNIGPKDARVFVARTGVEMLFQPDQVRRWFVAGAGGWARGDYAATNADFGRPMVSFGFGQRWQADRLAFRWEARCDRYLGNDGLGGADVANAQFLFGISLGVGGPPPDEDRDGVRDRDDACPGTPLGAAVDPKGCPLDDDGDGVLNGTDRCPGTPQGVLVDSTGCPADADGDGVGDAQDRCPGTPRGEKVDANGCPPDSDHDGVPDSTDRCAGTPAGERVDANGCPVDLDGDGVPNDRDRCPDTPRGVRVDANGCEIVVPPPPPPMLPERQKTLVLSGVNFEVDSAQLVGASAAVLDRVAASMREVPDAKVRVEGHTDSSGSAAHNLDLSRRRADAVLNYLVRAGIDRARLSGEGFGESRPVASNETREGKAMNRRVELRRVD